MARIRHLAIVTDNRERLVKFYTTVFGMKVIDGVGPAIYLSDGYLNLAIIQKRGNYKEGLYHFGFEVDDLDDIKRRLQEAGFDAEIDSKSDKDSDHRIQDPDGHLWEIVFNPAFLPED